jgi:hypothetical protein
MTRQPLTPAEQRVVAVAQQIKAVHWAIQRLDEMALRDDEMETMRPRLQAAVETLETMEFAREVLK